MPAKLTQEEFIKRARMVHGDEYGYSKSIYVNADSKVAIICSVHGVFYQLARSHYNGSNCPKCSNKAKGYLISFSKTKSTEWFLKKAKEKHGNKYDYSFVKYKHCEKKVTIVCPIHGKFKQAPRDHYKGGGCKKCGWLVIGNKQRLTKDEFIKKAIKIHGNKYNYDLVKYKRNNAKVKIICAIHGPFEQVPCSHLAGNGCPPCSYITTAKKRHVDLSGKRFGKLVVIGKHKRKKDATGKQTRTYFPCQCDCGNKKDVAAMRLKDGRTKSCGCLTKRNILEQKRKFIGKTFGKLTIKDALFKSRTRKEGKCETIYYECLCKCGVIKNIRADGILSGMTESCGHCGKILINNENENCIAEMVERSRRWGMSHKEIAENLGIAKNAVYTMSRDAGYDSSHFAKEMTTEAFIKKSLQIHGGRYDYQLVVYENALTEVKIICPIHGTFKQKPHLHLTSRGCAACARIVRPLKRAGFSDTIIDDNLIIFKEKQLKLQKAIQDAGREVNK